LTTHEHTLNGEQDSGPLPVVEVIELSKCFRARGDVGFFPWSRRKRRPVQEERGPGLLGGDDDDDDMDDDDMDDFEDDFDEPPHAEASEEPQRDTWALRDVSFTLPPGRTLGVIGENGSGKSTLIKLLSRVSAPTSGRVVIRGRIAPALSVVTGFIEPTRSGAHSVFQMARFFGIPKSVAESAIEPIRELSELGPALEQTTKSYSSGQLQRLAYAAMLCLDPDILVTDQAITVGDPGFRTRSLEALNARIEDGLTVVVTSPDTRRLPELCTDVLWLRGGRVEAFGPIDDVVPRYEREIGGARAIRVKKAARAGPDDPTLDAIAPPPPSRGPVSDVEIQTAGVYDANGYPTNVVRTSDDLLIELMFDVHAAPKYLRAVVALIEDGGARARIAQPESFDIDAPGVYAVSVHVPAGYLKPGSYDGRARLLDVEDGQRATVGQAAFDLEAVGDRNGGRAFTPEGALVWDIAEIGPLDR